MAAAEPYPHVVKFVTKYCLSFAATGFFGTLLPALLSAPSAAQALDGSVTASYAWLHAAGNADAYRTQWNVGQGFTLEGVSLSTANGTFLLEASGLGGAEPARDARVVLRPVAGVRFEATYARRDSFFGLADANDWGGREQWSRTRYAGKLAVDAGRTARVTLGVLRITRDGWAEQPFSGLNEVYLRRVTLDDTLTEGFVRVESLSLPVHLAFEQAFAKVLTRDRPVAPAGGGAAASGPDADLLAAASSDRLDERTIPTSRFSARTGGGAWEAALSLLFSRADLASTGGTRTAFDLDGGRVGRVEFLDQLAGSARQDAFAGDVRVAYLLAPGLALRVLADGRRSTNDGALLGQRLVRLASPSGTGGEIAGPLDDATAFDVDDGSARIELEKSFPAGVALWAGAFAASRDVSWTATKTAPAFDEKRTSWGGGAGVSLALSGGLKGDASYEGGAFSRYVFRTDPKTVNRVKARLAIPLAGGFSAGVRGGWEGDSNPGDVANLSYDARNAGLSAGWDAADGRTSFSLDADRVAMTSDVGLVLPAGGTSRYDTALWNVFAKARVPVGPVRLDVSGSWVEDRGETWPLTSWAAEARASVPLPARLEVSGFVQYRKYDEKNADKDDYEVTRYGVAVTWRLR